ncbi:histidine--tRNA ligase [Oligoflexia bacterium]|nr:histidine--tRNA ligase [Oligoflexia bacterium]
MAKISNISGFPEWLPEQKLAEDWVIEKIKGIYESHGFVPVETPSVELMSTLASKGVVDKELYVLRRANAEDDGEAELGLHFDLTVPIARYIALHFNDLVFPFKRYQLQRAWRGERPQKGRFREFYQFDIDTFGRNTLPLACDAEILTVLDKVYRTLNLGNYVIRVNNRKILLGLYSSLGLDGEQRQKAIVAIDKIDKLGEAAVLAELVDGVGVEAGTASKIVEFCKIKTTPEKLSATLSELAITDELFAEGQRELEEVLFQLSSETQSKIEVCLSLARGLDYYTGLIFETLLVDYPEFGSVGGGGRYDGLVSQFSNQKVPGVGVSLGITRLMNFVFENNLLPLENKTPTRVLVSVYSEEQRVACNEIADRVRACGVPTEVFFTSPKLGKQIDYAAKKNIPFVLFVSAEDNSLRIKDINSGEQIDVDDLEQWCGAIND